MEHGRLGPLGCWGKLEVIVVFEATVSAAPHHFAYVLKKERSVDTAGRCLEYPARRRDCSHDGCQLTPNYAILSSDFFITKHDADTG